MYSGKLVFSQLMDFMPMHQFHRCVDSYKGNHHVKAFSCLDQFPCMAFAQLSYRESLRDIESCLTLQRKLSYTSQYLGTVGKVGPMISFD